MQHHEVVGADAAHDTDEHNHKQDDKQISVTRSDGHLDRPRFVVSAFVAVVPTSVLDILIARLRVRSEHPVYVALVASVETHNDPRLLAGGRHIDGWVDPAVNARPRKAIHVMEELTASRNILQVEDEELLPSVPLFNLNFAAIEVGSAHLIDAFH